MNFANIDHSIVRYSRVWEDQRLVRKGLKITSTDRVLSIASGGCNVLDLVLAGAEEVHAIDLSESQLALLSLKTAAIKNLDYDDMLAFLGYRGCEHRLLCYDKVRPELSEFNRAYWDARSEQIMLGVSRIGRFDTYLDGFRTQVLERFLHPQLLNDYIAASTLEDARAAFLKIESERTLVVAAQQYFSREHMIQNGRHAAQFAFVPEVLDVGAYVWERFCWACKNTLLAGNPYLQLVVSGHYKDMQTSLLPFLRANNYLLLRARLPRLAIHQGRIDEVCHAHPRGYFNKINLSNIFEYVSEEDYSQTMLLLSERMQEDARLCYWNFLVERNSNCLPSGSFRRDAVLSNKLWTEDRSWLYRAFHVNVVRFSN